MHQRSEQEIMQNWKGDLAKPIVSVCCATYNHENYIAEAIDGFLMQETDFPFEILIRDDCSTDKTASIVKEYADKYSSLIKPVFEKENTYSKDVKPMPQLYKIAKGKYIALCEGDDYWTDKNKLQIQINKMNECEDYKISFHLSSSLYGMENEIKPTLKDSDKIYSVQDIITSDFHLVQTNTIVFTKEALQNLDMQLLYNSPVGDVWIRIAASIPNGAIFVNKVMSTYRVQSIGSWSESMQTDKKFLLFVKKMMKSIDDFNQYWNYTYTKEFDIYKNKFIKTVIQKSNIDKKDKKNFLQIYSSSITIENLLRWHLLYKHKQVLNFLKMIKHKIKVWMKR